MMGLPAGPMVSGQWPDTDTERYTFDLRTPLLGTTGPGQPGYIIVKRHTFKLASWLSHWPLNPESSAYLQGSTFSDIPLTEGRINWPLGGTEWLRLVNPEPWVPAGNILPDSGTYLLTLLLHNAELDPEHVQTRTPFVWHMSHLVPMGGFPFRLAGWGRNCTPGGLPPTDIATGYAPYRRVRVRFTVPVLPDTAQIIWRGPVPVLTEMIPTGDLVADPPASDSADVMYTNAGMAPLLPVDIIVRFD